MLKLAYDSTTSTLLTHNSNHSSNGSSGGSFQNIINNSPSPLTITGFSQGS